MTISNNELTIHLQSKMEESKSPNIITTTSLSSSTIPKHQVPLSTITIHIESLSLYNPLSLASLVSSLDKDGNGKVILSTSYDACNTSSSSSSSTSDSSSRDLTPIHTSIKLAGLTPQSESTSDDGLTRSITAIYKPKTNVKSTAATINQHKQKKGAIKINIGSDLWNNENEGENGDDDDVINEDDLLLSSSKINKPATIDMEQRQKDLNDCGGRKACDNCTCGRKEMEEEERGGGTKKLTEAPKSSCGNCAKGDAFRCAGCPYLGKPAFKEGEEHLVLDLTDDL